MGRGSQGGRRSSRVTLPTRYALQWSGQYENLARVKERLKLVDPADAVPDRRAALPQHRLSREDLDRPPRGAVFRDRRDLARSYVLGYNVSIATWVGLIALMGLDAETGVFMLLFLDLAWDERVKAGLMRTKADVVEAIVHGAVKRVRPKMMTVTAAFLGLLPIMVSSGNGCGHDETRRVRR